MRKKMVKTRKGKKIFAFALSVMVFFSSQSVTTPAGTVKGADSSADTGKWKNPVHNCSGENDYSPDKTADTTDWSYVSFGSYPQTEVTGDALTDEITGASYDGQGDALVNGTKYRRISKDDTTRPNEFGDKSYRYFKWEPVKWRVLENDGSALFLMADQGLDCKKFNEEYKEVTWEDSTLRQWLNGTFYSAAFSGKEQEAILEQSTGEETKEIAGGVLWIRFICFPLKKHFLMDFVNMKDHLQADGCFPVILPTLWEYLSGMVIMVITGVTGGCVPRGIQINRVWDTVQRTLIPMALFTDWDITPVLTWGWQFMKIPILLFLFCTSVCLSLQQMKGPEKMEETEKIQVQRQTQIQERERRTREHQLQEREHRTREHQIRERKHQIQKHRKRKLHLPRTR